MAGAEQPRTVTNAIRMTIGDRLENRFGTVVLARVHGLAKEMLMCQLVGSHVILRREATFLAGKIQPHHRQAVVFGRGNGSARKLERGHGVDLICRRRRQRLEVGLVVLAEHRQEKAQRTNNHARLKAWHRAGADRRIAIDLTLRALDPLTDRLQHLTDTKRTAHV